MPKREDGVDLLMRFVAEALPPGRDRARRLMEIALRLREQLGGKDLGYIKKPAKRA